MRQGILVAGKSGSLAPVSAGYLVGAFLPNHRMAGETPAQSRARGPAQVPLPLLVKPLMLLWVLPLCPHLILMISWKSQLQVLSTEKCALVVPNARVLKGWGMFKPP